MAFPLPASSWHPRAWRDDLLVAVRLLTRLPFGRAAAAAPPAASHPARCYPLVGLGVGAIAAGTFTVAAWLALPPVPAAMLALAATVLATGALHEDGLADVADGFGGGHDRDRKLAIMRDSRIGTYGVLALALVLAGRGGSVAAIADPGAAAAALLAAHTLSRAGLASLMWGLPPARSDGLAAATGRPGGIDALSAALIGVAAALLLLDLAVAVTALLACAVAQFGLAALARRQIGGVTGDVLGAAQQLGELAVLLVAAAGIAGSGGAASGVVA